MFDYVGRTYKDCWSFVVAYYDASGQTISQWAHENSSLFVPVDEPENGDLALIRKSAHAGIYRDNGILHQYNEDLGVVYQHVREFPQRPKYYRHISRKDMG